MASPLFDKLNKNSTIKYTASLSKSKIFGQKEMVSTIVPMINVGLSGDPDGGLTPGLTVIAGPSRHFKTLFALVMGAAFLDQHKDGILLFYDSEFGTPKKYFESLNIDMDRVVHTPITDIEELKHDIMVQLKELTRDDKVCIIIDSIGNLASIKEKEDAEAGKTVADMTNGLYEIHRKTKELKVSKDKPTDETAITVDKAVFVGTTKDLLRSLKQQKNEENS